MTPRERILKSLSHQSPDRIPVDFGSTAVTGIHVWIVEKLREYFGLERKLVKVIEPYQMLGEMDEELLDALEIDTIGVIGRSNMFGIENKDWKAFKTFWNQEILFPGEFNTKLDENGDLLIFPEGDTSVLPSAKMPKAGFFFDAIIRQEPIDDSNLNVEDNLEEFTEVSSEDLSYWKTAVEDAKETGRAIVATFGGTAIGDIALIPAMQLKHPKGIRDIAEWYMSTIMRTEYLHQIFTRQTDIALTNFEKIKNVVGNNVDVVFLCGADFGTQDTQFCSQETFVDLYFPYYKKINDWIHRNTTWKSFKHSCGAVEPLMKHFIDAGFDIINPVQISAADMDPEKLKKNYGENLVFWGGGVDTQKVLSFGKPEDVEKNVIRMCEIFSKDGGFVFNTVHNIQANTPIENVIAMFNAVRKFNGMENI
jgi:uroporphyrinogen-III decarboxylase